jgi:predicted ATP-dependent endonuclease of OLD family
VTHEVELIEASNEAQKWSKERDHASALVVRNPQEKAYAIEFVKQLKLAQKRITEFADPVVKSAKATYDTARKQRDGLLQPFVDAEKLAKEKILFFDQEEQQRVAEEQRKLQAKLEADARAERERLRKAAEKLKTPELREERLAEAEAVIAPAVMVQQPDKVAGVSTSTRYKAELVDFNELLKAATLNDGVALSFLMFDQVKANAFMRATKGQVPVPGVQAVEDRSLNVRTGA